MTERPWSLDFSTHARRDLRRLDPQVRARVVIGLERVVANPGQAVGVRKLTGSEESRLRIGDWRVRFIRDEKERVIHVTRVLPRGRAYDR